jgi:hypothetical protein
VCLTWSLVSAHKEILSFLTRPGRFKDFKNNQDRAIKSIGAFLAYFGLARVFALPRSFHILSLTNPGPFFPTYRNLEVPSHRSLENSSFASRSLEQRRYTIFGMLASPRVFHFLPAFPICGRTLLIASMVTSRYLINKQPHSLIFTAILLLKVIDSRVFIRGAEEVC